MTAILCLGGKGVDLQRAYNASAAGEVVVDSSRGAVKVRDNATPIGADLFAVESNAPATLFGVDLAEASLGVPMNMGGNNITAAADILGASDIRILPSGDTSDGLILRTTSNDPVITSIDDTRKICLGGDTGLSCSIAIAGLDQPRANVKLLPLGNAGSPYTSVPTDLGMITWESIVECNHASATFGAFISATGTFRQQQSGFLFNNGLIFNNAIVFENLSGAAANFGPVFTLVDQPLIRSTGGARTMSQQASVRAQPRFGPHTGGGTLTVTSVWSFFCGGTISAGTAVTTWTGLYAGAPTLSGSLTNWIGVDFPDNAVGTNRTGIQSALNSPAWFISHTGSAPSWFGATIQLGNAIPITFGGANVVTLDKVVANTLRFLGAGEDMRLLFSSNLITASSTTGAAFRFNMRLDINNPIALGGGAAATLGTIGATGPTAAAQSKWIEIDVAGVPHWIPAWI